MRELNTSTMIRIHGLGYPTAKPPENRNATKQTVDQMTVDARGVLLLKGSIYLSAREYWLLNAPHVLAMSADTVDAAISNILHGCIRSFSDRVVALEGDFERIWLILACIIIISNGIVTLFYSTRSPILSMNSSFTR
jgi:hypothetical protein